MELPDHVYARYTRAGLNLIQQALSIYDRELRLVVSNRRFQEMFGLPDRLVRPGAGFAETIRYLAERGEYGPIDDIDGFVADRVEQARAFEPHYMERTRANGQVIAIEGSPLHEGGWVAVYTDITDIRRQEALLKTRSEKLHHALLARSEALARSNRQLEATIKALEQTRHDLARSEAHVRMTTEMMPAHIARVDLEGRYTYSNRKLPTVVPGRPADVVGLHIAQALGEEAWSRIRGPFERALSGEASTSEISLPSTGRRVRVALTPDRDEEGRIRGVYILSMDITAEAQARAALLQTHRRTLAAQLTSGLAHDFSNLLTIILGLQSRIAERKDLPEEVRELARMTQAAARRGGRILERLSRISGPRMLRLERTDLARLLHETAALAAPSLPEGIRLETRLGTLPGPVWLDGESLQDSLLNLVLNARDAIAPAEGVITIACAPLGEEWLEIRVEDNGPGFNEEALENAVQPFYTSRRNADGTGLGLSMVYDFVQLAGGHLILGNRPEGGARVTMRLPLRPAGEARELLVLLIDDESDIRAQTRRLLRELGHKVVEASCLEEAEALIGAIDGIDFILTDLLLEGGGRGDVFLARHALPGGILTSLPAGDARRRTAESVAPVMGKPATPDALAAFIEHCLGVHLARAPERGEKPATAAVGAASARKDAR